MNRCDYCSLLIEQGEEFRTNLFLHKACAEDTVKDYGNLFVEKFVDENSGGYKSFCDLWNLKKCYKSKAEFCFYCKEDFIDFVGKNFSSLKVAYAVKNQHSSI